MADQKQLLIDKDAADVYLRKYQRHLDTEKDATGQMLNSAIEKFYKFLEVPPASNRFADVLAGAWEILSVAVPMLGGLKAAENIFNICVKAEELTTKLAPAMRAGQRMASAVDQAMPLVGKVANVVQKSNLAYSTTADAITKMTADNPDIAKPFGNLDIAKQIRLNFVNTIYLRMAAIDVADNALHAEYANRLNGIKSNPDATLALMAARLLPLPSDITGVEYDQIETRILYELISLYMKRNVTFNRTISKIVGGGEVVGDTVDSINSNQMDLFSDWFGGLQHRGKYFSPAFIQQTWLETNEMFFHRMMRLQNCRTITTIKYVNYGRHPGEV